MGQGDFIYAQNALPLRAETGGFFEIQLNDADNPYDSGKPGSRMHGSNGLRRFDKNKSQNFQIPGGNAVRARDGGQWKRSGRCLTFLTIAPTYDKFSLAALHMQIYLHIPPGDGHQCAPV